MRRGIYALVVGIGSYPDRARLKAAVPAANDFIESIEEYKPYVAILTDGADVQARDWQLPKGIQRQFPGKFNVESAFDRIADVPAGSLILFYFAGHGDRRHYADGEVGELRFVVPHRRPGESDGASRPEPEQPPIPLLARSVGISDLIESLYRARGSKFIGLIDCCYAGELEDDLDNVHPRLLRRIDHTGFLLAAGSGVEKARVGILTRHVLETWANPNPGSCLRPEAFLVCVQDKVLADPHGGMLVQSWGGGRLAQCFAALHEDSSFLVVDFEPDVFERPVHVVVETLNGSVRESYDPGQPSTSPVAFVVPRESLTITLTSGAGPASRTVTVSSQDLSKGYLRLYATPEEVSMEREHASLQRVASFLDDAGADASDLYLEMARLEFEGGEVLDVASATHFELARASRHYNLHEVVETRPYGPAALDQYAAQVGNWVATAEPQTFEQNARTLKRIYDRLGSYRSDVVQRAEAVGNYENSIQLRRWDDDHWLDDAGFTYLIGGIMTGFHTRDWEVLRRNAAHVRLDENALGAMAANWVGENRVAEEPELSAGKIIRVPSDW